ncbi:MAG: tRNA-binding protein [Candidatus Eremiobacteraeota bacterium]|nr:tRNA-binding protein [Candidatus Eremiobacteraeota bacterium]
MDALTAFVTLDIRVGTIAHAERLTDIRKSAYALTIDFGPPVGFKRSAAQVTALYAEHELVGRQVLGVVNLPPKKIGAFVSEVLVLGVADESERVILLVPERKAPNGAKLF